MGIDRIGKGSAPPPPKEGIATERAQRTDAKFEVRPEAAAEASRAHAVAPTAASPLDRLRAGEIDVDGYVDLKLDQATAHLHGLPAGELATIRATLRERLVSDPTLADLVQRATGRALSPKE